MFSFRRLALLVAFIFAAVHALPAQDSSSSSSATQSSSSAAPQAQQQPANPQNTQGMSVQARIRERREQRTRQAIHDTYDQRYELFLGAGYLRFSAGPHIQRVTLYSWNTDITRYYSQRLGATIDARGYYGTPYVGLNSVSITRPSISLYDVMGGPTYRVRMRPRYSISARALGGWSMGNFSGDTGGFSAATVGLYPDSSTFVLSGAVIGEANLSPSLSLRLGGEDLVTGFGSNVQNGVGVQYGLVYRFGKR